MKLLEKLLDLFRKNDSKGIETIRDIHYDFQVADIKDFCLHNLLKESEESIEGEMFLARADEIGNPAGEDELDWLLANQEQIPKEWQKRRIILTGYIMDTEFGWGLPYCLFFINGQWHRDHRWLFRGFTKNDRLLTVCK